MTAIHSLMKGTPITVTSDATAKDAAAKMAEHNCGAVMVCDGAELVAIFSERDLLTRVVTPGLDPATTKVGDVATREVTSVKANADLAECFALLKGGSFRHLPIVDADGKPIGMVSARDFYKSLMMRMEEFVDMTAMSEQVKGLAHLLDGDAFGPPAA